MPFALHHAGKQGFAAKPISLNPLSNLVFTLHQTILSRTIAIFSG
jgi:hypothetical protein